MQRDVGPKFWKRLSNALGHTVNKTTLRAILTHLDDSRLHRAEVHRAIDWGEAPNVSAFCGRIQEMQQLTQWMTQDRCRLIAIAGFGGIGKTALAAKVAYYVQDQFDFIVWRSLRNASPLETLLTELVPFLSGKHDIQATPTRLLHWLRTHRCLVILDNHDTLLQTGVRAGIYQPDFAAYGELFRLVSQP